MSFKRLVSGVLVLVFMIGMTAVDVSAKNNKTTDYGSFVKPDV